MEEFDLVNEKDEVIGVTTKEKAHANAEIHRVVAVFVFTVDGKLYLQHHLVTGKLDHSVGGHVDRGETYDEAVKREAAEELGLQGPYTKIVHFFSDETMRGNRVKHFFTVYECLPQNWQFIPNDEVQEITPWRMEEVVERMNHAPEEFTGGFLNTMREYIKAKNLPYNLK